MKIEFIRMQILKASQANELSFDNNDVMGELTWLFLRYISTLPVFTCVQLKSLSGALSH